jgi:hypothetical protein
MKKTITIFAAATLFLAACNNTTNTENTATTTDSTLVQVDTVAVQADSTSVDTLATK